MANEIRGVSSLGVPLYARVMNPAGQLWNGVAFETYLSADWANYAVVMTEQGTSQVYVANFPAVINLAGTYEIFVHAQVGASPAESDPVVSTSKVDWTGVAVANVVAGSMTGSDFRDYVLRKGFKRTDKDTEVYEAITDAVQILRRRFSFSEAEAEIVTTQIIPAGDFKMPVEPDMGLIVGIISEKNNNAIPLDRITKRDFDLRYPFMNIDTTYTGLPLVYSVFADQVYIGPRPDATDYVYRISYSKRGGVVTSSTSSVPFTALYRDVLCNLVLSLLNQLMEEFDKADYYESKYENEMIKVERRERLNSGEDYFQQDYRDI